MPRKKSHITITDQFCGAGGSSQGARNYGRRMGGGVEIKLALNHWKLAIETHNTNFPDTDHDCTDISASDPRRYISTDILITSPECTNHSLAKGQKIVQKQMDLFALGVMDPGAEEAGPLCGMYAGLRNIILITVSLLKMWWTPANG